MIWFVSMFAAMTIYMWLIYQIHRDVWRETKSSTDLTATGAVLCLMWAGFVWTLLRFIEGLT